MIDNYFDTYVTTAIDEINKFNDKRFAYGAKPLPKMRKAYRIVEQKAVSNPDADYVCVALEEETRSVKLWFVSPTKPSADLKKTIPGNEFSANPLDSFLKQAFNF